jgi:hypothetical protein
MRRKGTNCLSEASFWTRRIQIHKQGESRLVGTKVAGGLSFDSFSLAAKENEGENFKVRIFLKHKQLTLPLLGYQQFI